MNAQDQTMKTKNPPFFFRAADRMRVQGCVNALVQDAVSLAVSCEQEALLDHYLDILLTELHDQAPWLQQDVYFPTSTEYLVARFNEILAEQTVQQAIRSGNDQHRARVWVVHDAQSLPEAELQLLARLIQNFPGANIRALLVIAGPAARQPQLSAFGRKLLKWDIEPPTKEQALLILEATSDGTERSKIETLLRRMGILPAALSQEPAPLSPLDTSSDGTVPPAIMPKPPSTLNRWVLRIRSWNNGNHASRWWRTLTTASRSVRMFGSARLPRVPLAVQPAAFKNTRLVMVGLGLLLFSGLVTIFLQRQSSVGTPASTANQATAAAVVPAVEALKTASSASPDHANTAVADKEVMPVGHAWASALPPLSFVLQHASVSNLGRAEGIIKNNPTLRQAKVVITYRPGDAAPQYVVVSGPFEPVGQAYEKARTPGLPAGTWVRSTSDMQSQLKIPAAMLEAAR